MLTLALAGVSSFVSVGVAGAQPSPRDGLEETAPHVAGQVLVGYKPGVGPEHRRSLRRGYGGRLLRKLPLDRVELLKAQPGTVDETIAALLRDPRVAYAEPNYVYETNSLPNDTHIGQLWALHNGNDADIDAPQTWDLTTGSASVLTAVVDSGVALDHPDLAPNVWRNPGESGSGKESNGIDDDGNGYVDDYQGWDWIGDDRFPRDLHGHGTHVAGIIAARGNDATGIAGVAYNSRIMALRALNSVGSGTTADIAAAFAYAAANGAKVVNASFGSGGYSQTMLNAIVAAPGTLFVTAAGNEKVNNDVTASYPCNYPAPNIICVGASDSDDQLASFSNFGSMTVDLVAPGTGILSTQPAFTSRFNETFDTGVAGWSSGGSGGAFVHDATGFVTDGAGDYASGADHWFASNTSFDLSQALDCRLSFAVKLDVQSGDALVTEATTDGVTWSELGRWSGSSDNKWISAADPLFAFDGRAGVRVRFRFISNLLGSGEGVSLDNVSVLCTSPKYSGTEYLYAGGTSMAAPHVAGVAALAWSAQPSATVAQIYSALLEGADDKPAFTGKTVSGGRLNACRTVVLVAPAPGDPCSDAVPPQPTPDPSPSATPQATPSATPTPTSSPTPAPQPSVEPEPSPSPNPTADPEPSPTPSPETSNTTHERSITLRITDSHVARGRVLADDGYGPCTSSVYVKIMRNGRFLQRTVTRSDGSYRVQLARRSGRYVARAPDVAVAGHSCTRAVSSPRFV